jgi:hypothetical protein
METQTLLGWIVFQFMHQFLQKKLRWVRIIFRHGNIIFRHGISMSKNNPSTS